MNSPVSASSQQSKLRRTNTAGRLAVYFLLVCSAVLLFHSFKLESVRLETWLRESVTTTSRLLPEYKVNEVESSDFYVPSLDYRIKGVSQYSRTGKDAFDAHVYCKKFEKDLLWEWWRPNDGYNLEEEPKRLLRKKTTNHAHTTKKRLLIGITSGYDESARLLERAVWSARVYGALWSGDSENTDVTVVVLQGTAFSPHGCKSPPSHSSIDKIRVLFEAIDSEDQYDRLLLLDADTMIYGMDTDLSALAGGSDDFVVMGAPLLGEDGKKNKDKPWELSTGVTLWNLEHHSTSTVALEWFNYAKNAIIRGSYQSDQKYLHKALKMFYSTNSDGLVTRNSDRDIGMIKLLEGRKFGSQGSIVKQFSTENVMNADGNLDINIHDGFIKARVAQMKKAAKKICDKYPDICDKVGSPPKYERS